MAPRFCRRLYRQGRWCALSRPCRRRPSNAAPRAISKGAVARPINLNVRRHRATPENLHVRRPRSAELRAGAEMIEFPARRLSPRFTLQNQGRFKTARLACVPVVCPTPNSFRGWSARACPPDPHLLRVAACSRDLKVAQVRWPKAMRRPQIVLERSRDRRRGAARCGFA